MSTKPLWLVANWKSKQPLDKALAWPEALSSHLPSDSLVKVVVCPPHSQIYPVKNKIEELHLNIIVGSQNLSCFPPGAYTGEEPAENLKDLVKLSIIGHSERRQNFAETPEIIEQKVKLALDHQIIPLLCVQDAATPIPDGVSLIAYEPIFAIGTGKPDTPENAASVARNILQSHPGVKILYGGSVTAENVQSFVSLPEISGVLVGGASLDPVSFGAIIQSAQVPIS